MSACVHVQMWSILGLTLRGRGLPVHVDTPVTRLDQWYPVECSLVVAVVHPTKHHHTALRLVSVERRQWGDSWKRVTTALSERFSSPPIKALIKSSSTDAEIEARKDWEPDCGTDEVRS